LDAFVGVLLVVVFTPGPDFAVVLRHALACPARPGARGSQWALGVARG
jgi:threonine/homoserine/homoserine lactone efflux protein